MFMNAIGRPISYNGEVVRGPSDRGRILVSE
jgi:hypothetical protein